MIVTQKARLLGSVSLLAILVTGVPAKVFAEDILPTNGRVQAGVATVGTPAKGVLTINQISSRAVIDWSTFSIGAQNAVNFVQPDANSATLNRVTGSATSTLAGSLTATGSVYLINPNGIQITSSGTVDVGNGFVASSLDITNKDFLAGKDSFNGTGTSASVTNAGRIATSSGGFVALLGGTVTNSGVISAPLGKIGLGSGEQATLDINGDQFLQVSVPTNATDADGKPLVTNSGKIIANGGQVVLTAATAKQAVRNAINMPGSISATSVTGKNGAIILSGGDSGLVSVTGNIHASMGKVAISGNTVTLKNARVDVSSKTRTGGAVSITATNAVTLINTTIDASGTTGGTVLIGGDLHGSGTLSHAQSVAMDNTSVIHADGLVTGNGGEVVLWSDGETNVVGLITAEGGIVAGNGGIVETSGHKVDFTGLTVNTSATTGTTGLWLIDPTNLTVDGSAAATINSNLATTDVTLTTTATTASGTGTQTSGAGDIDVNAPISWSTANTLTLNAYNSINVVSSITATGNGKLVLSTSNGSLNFYSGNIELLGSSAALTINGTNYTLIQTVAELTNINSNVDSGSHVVGNYALAKPLDLGGTTYTDGVIAGSSSAGFIGTFNGLGNTISNLTINADSSGKYLVGLFGQIGNASNNSAGTVENIGLIGGSVTDATGSASIGALAGTNTGTIINAYATTSVTGTNTGAEIGGLVGYNWGTMTNVHASGNVTDTAANSWVGGLVGYNDGYTNGGGVGTITNAYATGAVTGSNTGTGGLGIGTGTGSDTGGLVGINLGAITNVYSTGAVTAHSGTYIGGLIGENDTTDGPGTVTNGYWDKTTSGISTVGTGAGTPETTAVLQDGTLPGGFSSSVWSAISGKYPVLGPRILTLNLLSQSATYGSAYSLDQTSAAYTETENGTTLTGGNLVTLTGMSISVAGTGSTSGTTSSTNAGSTYELSATGAAASGYTIAYGAGPVYLTVNPLAVTLTGSQVYNGGTSVAASVLTLTNGISGATTASIGLSGTGSVASANVSAGSQSLNLSGLSLTNSNYTLTGGSGTVTITPLAVALTGSQTYDRTTNAPAAGLSLSNGVLGATAASIGLSGTGILSSSNAGTQTLTSTTGSLTGLSVTDTNYTVTGGSGTITVNPATLTYSIADATSTYGTLAVSGTAILTGVIGGDTANVQANVGIFSGASQVTLAANTPAGSYSEKVASLTGSAASNYTIAASGNTAGTLTINKAALTISADDKSMTYGGTLPTLTLSYSGFVNGDSAASLTTAPTVASATSASANAGTYTGTISANGAVDPNYTVSYNSGTLTINKAALTITPTAQSKTYGSTLSLDTTRFNDSGLVNSDTITGLTLTSSGTVATATVGTYNITASGATGTGLANYSITYGTGTNALTVNPAHITVTALGGTSVYGSSSTNPGLSATGLQNGQTVSALTGLSNSFGVTNSTNVGTVTLNVLGTLTNGNYTIDSRTAANWTVTPATLTYVANSVQRLSGVVNPPLTGSVTGFVNTDTLASATTGTLLFSTAATTNSITGSYGILGSGLAANNGNYIFVQAPGNATALTVIPSQTNFPDRVTPMTVGDRNLANVRNMLSPDSYSPISLLVSLDSNNPPDTTWTNCFASGLGSPPICSIH